jgi:hypothetical protein
VFWLLAAVVALMWTGLVAWAGWLLVAAVCRHSVC